MAEIELLFRSAVPEWGSNAEAASDSMPDDRDVIGITPPRRQAPIELPATAASEAADADYRGALATSGYDFIAFYRSYHEHGPAWGIYFYADRLV